MWAHNWQVNVNGMMALYQRCLPVLQAWELQHAS